MLLDSFHRLSIPQILFYAFAVTSSRATEWYSLLHRMVVMKYNLGPSTWFCYLYFKCFHCIHPLILVINHHYNQLHHCCKLWFVLIFCIFSLKNQWPWNSPSWWKRVKSRLEVLTAVLLYSRRRSSCNHQGEASSTVSGKEQVLERNFRTINIK